MILNEHLMLCRREKKKISNKPKWTIFGITRAFRAKSPLMLLDLFRLFRITVNGKLCTIFDGCRCLKGKSNINRFVRCFYSFLFFFFFFLHGANYSSSSKYIKLRRSFFLGRVHSHLSAMQATDLNDEVC